MQTFFTMLRIHTCRLVTLLPDSATKSLRTVSSEMTRQAYFAVIPVPPVPQWMAAIVVAVAVVAVVIPVVRNSIATAAPAHDEEAGKGCMKRSACEQIRCHPTQSKSSDRDKDSGKNKRTRCWDNWSLVTGLPVFRLYPLLWTSYTNVVD